MYFIPVMEKPDFRAIMSVYSKFHIIINVENSCAA